MIYEVMSERDAISYSCEPDILKTAIVSIRNPSDGNIEFPKNGNIWDVLHIRFYDSEEELCGSITREDALRIADFVLRCLKSGEAEELLFHCKEGVSRSAGVCAAVLEELTGDASEIFDDPHYRPNMRCYSYVKAALELCRH